MNELEEERLPDIGGAISATPTVVPRRARPPFYFRLQGREDAEIVIAALRLAAAHVDATPETIRDIGTLMVELDKQMNE